MSIDFLNVEILITIKESVQDHKKLFINRQYNAKQINNSIDSFAYKGYPLIVANTLCVNIELHMRG